MYLHHHMSSVLMQNWIKVECVENVSRFCGKKKSNNDLIENKKTAKTCVQFEKLHINVSQCLAVKLSRMKAKKPKRNL